VGDPDPSWVLANSADGVAVCDAFGTVLWINTAAEAMLGLGVDVVRGTNMVSYLHPDDLDVAVAAFSEASDGTLGLRPLVRLRSTDGETLVEVRARRTEIDDERVVVVGLRDDSGGSLRVAFESLAESVFLCNAEGLVTFTNSAARSILDPAAGQISTAASLDAVLQSIDGRTPTDPVQAALDGTTTKTGTYRLVGGEHERVVVVSAHQSPAVNQVRPGCVVTLRDVTDQHHAIEALRWQATRDPLTGLFNRRGLMTAIEELLSAETDVAVLFCDIDSFKTVNDRHGHRAGDAILRDIASRLVRASSHDPSAVVGRLGGDEFVVAGHLDLAAATALANRVREMAGSGETDVAATSLSIGVAIAPMGAATVDDALLDAANALRAAKDGGRDRVAVYDDAARRAHRRNTDIEALIRRCIAEGSLVVQVQPVVDIVDRRIVSGEALLRLYDDDAGELILPGRFIDVALRARLLPRLDLWSFEQAALLSARLRGDLGDAAPIVSSNLSLATLSLPDLPDVLRSIVRTAGADSAQLCIEVTEQEAPHELDAVKSTLADCTAHGIRVALDDFGTGYSSISSIRRLPVDSIKLDRSLSIAEPGTPDDTIARSTTSMAHALNCLVVAEGVETEDQFAWAIDRGCDFVQGFLVHRPMDVDDFVALVRTRR
jgi:diguanylate cyclase (GGDEF)-like protein/PAS domain S-box-containing protein